MDKLKDILYNKSDILTALLIVCIGALVIAGRVDAIMAYPETLSANAYTQQEDLPVTAPPEDDPLQSGLGTSAGAVTASGGGIDNAGQVEMYSVYINYGESMQTIGSKFVQIGLFESTEQFVKLVDKLGVGTKIKAGNFIMPATSTPEEVIGYITKSSL